MADISTTKTKVCSEKNSEKSQISLIVYNSVLSSNPDYSGYQKYHVSYKEKISLLQKPDESGLLELSLSSRYDCNYGRYYLEYNFKLTFLNNLHEVTKDYGYEIDFYLHVHENNVSSHALLFSQRQIRETNQIIIYNNTADSPTHPSREFIKKLLVPANKPHMCCSIRRYNIKITEDTDKEAIENMHIGAMLFETGVYSDVSLVVGEDEKSFRAHKHVLSSASDIFKAIMFSHDILENQEGRIIIEDFDSIVVEGLLSFIYTGKTSLLSEMPIELFQAAHRYEIHTLKTKCVEQFLFILNCENVVDILRTASTYELTDLKTRFLKFIDNHEEEMVKENSFQTFLRLDLKIDTVTYTLKLCDKYNELLGNVEAEAFKFIKENYEPLGSNEEFLKLFETHSLLIRRLYVFIHKND